MSMETPAIVRFFYKVNTSGPLIVDTPCWQWTGAKNRDGYGQFWFNQELVRAHRYCYELSFKSIPKDKLLMHRCDNPSCVNPLHLTPGTDAENTADKIAKGRDMAKLKSKRISREVSDQIRAEFAAGAPRKVLYAKYQVCQKTFRQIVQRERAQDRMTPEEMAGRKRPHLKPEMKAEIRRLREAGESIVDIAKRLGISTTSVNKYARPEQTGSVPSDG